MPLIKVQTSATAPQKAEIESMLYRVINFCDLEAKTEFRLVTNLPALGEAAVSDDEIRDIYRLR